jgi:iron complex outermembrane recepter protein
MNNNNTVNNLSKKLLCVSISSASLLMATQTWAQGGFDIMLEEVVVTATKKNINESVQDVPLAITALGSDQLDVLQVRDLQSLSYEMPNVSLDPVGTYKGVANFTIRGLGINSSIPSIDPTVGVFVDGMYLGVNWGVNLDMFDVESVEVLRGPQGLLFGRNVTGGAVIVNTKDPSEEFDIASKASVEGGGDGGLNYTVMGYVSGPVTDQVGAKLALYHNNDEGWFKNQFTGEDHGASESYIVRPSVKISFSETTDLTIKLERGQTDADGAASQNRAAQDKDTFDLSFDEPGFTDIEWSHAVFELNWDVDFGDGTITNIAGWRDLEQSNVTDIDGLPRLIFHSSNILEQDQMSNELRYTGRFFDSTQFTTGLYYFTQDMAYQAARTFGSNVQTGGGLLDHESWGVFLSADIDLTDDLTLNVGGRYTYEEKSVKIATQPLNRVNTPTPSPSTVFPALPGQCNVLTSCNFDFIDSDDWNSFTPKVGIQWRVNEDSQMYAYYTKGFRSGGYNLRSASADVPPGPFDQETQDSVEFGAKYQTPDRRIKANFALFYNKIEDMQREVSFSTGATIVQIIQNTAEATIQGAELELQYLPLDQLLLTASAGYTDGSYDKVFEDLTRDSPPVVDDRDLALDIPRLAPWTYNVGANFNQPIGSLGELSARISWAHRDKSYFNDTNTGVLRSADIINASVALTPPSEVWTFTLYGKNLKNEVTESVNIPTSFGSFTGINKGRVYGLEVQYSL